MPRAVPGCCSSRLRARLRRPWPTAHPARGALPHLPLGKAQPIGVKSASARSESPASQRQARAAQDRPPSPPARAPSIGRSLRRRPNRIALARREQYRRAR
eukprot:13579520-Alexandrium_andersonii.AAC.1